MVNSLTPSRKQPLSALLMPLAALMPILMAMALIAVNPEFETNPAVHWVLQLISAIMLATCAGIVLRRQNGPRSTYDYLLAIGLVAAAVLEATHGLLISFNPYPEALERIIPWGWLPSRIVLPALIIAAIACRYFCAAQGSLNRTFILAMATAASLFTLGSLFFLLVKPQSLPPIYFHDQLVHRPTELLPAVLFFIALAAQLKLSPWRSSMFDYTLLLALGVAVIAHSLLMPFAPGNFTNMFAAAVGAKILGYVLMLAAFIVRSREDMVVEADEVRLRHQAIVETANDAIITFDEFGVIDSFNPGATRLFGYTESEAIGANITLLTPPELRQPHDLYMARVRDGDLAHSSAFNYEATGLRKDGSVFPVESAISEVQMDGRGHYTAIVRDITQRKAEQARLEEISDRLTLALESANLGTWEQDLDNGKLTWNKRMFELYERDPAIGEPDQLEWVGQTIEEDRDACFEHYNAALEQGQPIDIVYRVNLGNERIRWIRANGRLVEGDKQRPRRLVGVNQDISSSIEHLEEVERARQQADDANRAKSTFLATMSHEIRTPLNGVIGLTEVLRKTRLDDYQTDVARLIDQSANSLLEIIEDILDISKIEAGKLEIDPTKIDPGKIAKDVCEMLSNVAQKSDVSLDLTLDSSLPETAIGDGHRLRQILTNLVSNAIKFSSLQAGGGRVEVAARCVEERDSETLVEFSVTDNGIGMDDSTLTRLFSPFTQADASTSRQFGGSGLGLTISQRLAKLMGGEITVTSALDQGSRFCVTLPFGRPQTVLETTGWEPSSETAKNSVGTNAAGLTREDASNQKTLILVAEDNETNQAVIEFQLSELGYQADIASNGEEALKAWRSGHYALLLTDLQMPEVDGYELARRVREQENPDQRIPIVALSANTLMDEEENCLASGMNAYLSKPVALGELEATLDKWLQG